MPGYLQLNVARHIELGANASMFFKAGTTLVKVPVNVGVKGTVTGFFTVTGMANYVTVDFYAWTPHTVAATPITRMRADRAPSQRKSPAPTDTVTGSCAEGVGWRVVQSQWPRLVRSVKQSSSTRLGQ